MARLCEGRVALVTGAARGVGREHALLLAKHGARSGERSRRRARRQGADLTPAQQVVQEIKAMGGEAVVNGDDVSDWNGAKRMVDQAISTFGKLDVVLSNAGILRDRMLTNMTEEEWMASSRCTSRAPSRRPVTPAPIGATSSGDRPAGERPADHHDIGVGHLRQCRPDQLRCGQGRHRRLHGDRRARDAPLRRHLELDLAVGLYAHDRRPQAVLAGGSREARSKWVAPIAVWLASEESGDITGRVFQAGSGQIAVAEGWHKGPTIPHVADPTTLGPIVKDMVAKARKNAGMDGMDLD